MRYYLLSFKTPSGELLHFDKITIREILKIVKEQMFKHYHLTEDQYSLNRDIINNIIKGNAVARLLTSIIELSMYPKVDDINKMLSIKS